MCARVCGLTIFVSDQCSALFVTPVRLAPIVCVWDGDWDCFPCRVRCDGTVPESAPTRFPCGANENQTCPRRKEVVRSNLSDGKDPTNIKGRGQWHKTMTHHEIFAQIKMMISPLGPEGQHGVGDDKRWGGWANVHKRKIAFADMYSAKSPGFHDSPQHLKLGSLPPLFSSSFSVQLSDLITTWRHAAAACYFMGTKAGTGYHTGAPKERACSMVAYLQCSLLRSVQRGGRRRRADERQQECCL